MVPSYAVLVAFCVMILEVRLAKSRLFIGDCSYRFCEQNCTQVKVDMMECYCNRGFSLKADGRKCIKSFDDNEDISGDGASGEPGNCDNEDGNCDKSISEEVSSGEEDIDADEGSGSESSVLVAITPSISKISIKGKESATAISTFKANPSITNSQVIIGDSVSAMEKYTETTAASTAELITNTQIDRKESTIETSSVKETFSVSKSQAIFGVSPFIKITPIYTQKFILQSQIHISTTTTTVSLFSTETLTPYQRSVSKHTSLSSSSINMDLADVKVSKLTDQSKSVSISIDMSSLSTVVESESLPTTLYRDNIPSEESSTVDNFDGYLTYSITSDIQSIYKPTPFFHIKPNTTVITNNIKVVPIEGGKTISLETGILDISTTMKNMIMFTSTPTMSASKMLIMVTFTPTMSYSKKKEVLTTSSSKSSLSVSVVTDNSIKVVEMDDEWKVRVKLSKKETIDDSASLLLKAFIPATVIPKSSFDKLSTRNIIGGRTTPLEIIATNIMTTTSSLMFPLKVTPSYIKSAVGEISTYIDKSEDLKQPVQSVLPDSESVNAASYKTHKVHVGTSHLSNSNMIIGVSSFGLKMTIKTDRKSIIQSSSSKRVRETVSLKSTKKSLVKTTKLPKVTKGSHGYKLVISYYLLSLLSVFNIIYLL